MSNMITLPELMPPNECQDAPIFRKRRRRLPKCFRIISAVMSICAVVCVLFVLSAIGNTTNEPQATEPPAADSDTAYTTSEDSEITSPPETLPVVLPIEGESTEALPETSAQKETEPQSSPVETTISLPDGAFPIKEASISSQRADLVNYTSHTFNSNILEVMSSAVIAPNKDGASVLVISTHTTECYLPAGSLYYHPSEHSTHSENPEENMIAVASAFCEALRKNGIEAVHVTAHCDSDGSGKAYINARNEIARAIAENPKIKYVIDIERATDINSSSELLRSSVILGQRSYAPIKLTVSGGDGLDYSRICQNLSFALKLNAKISEQSAYLTRPVQIADAVYTDGNSPRNLKIEVGSYTSTLDEAVSSASLLGELFALLLNS